jgi:hypothetical protein
MSKGLATQDGYQISVFFVDGDHFAVLAGKKQRAEAGWSGLFSFELKGI